MNSRARSFHEKRISRANLVPKERILIVCEGSKTEPNYFKEVIDEYRLPTANVKIHGKDCGSSPTTVVEFASKCFDSDQDFDLVYCVFDRDQHQDYSAARDRCLSLKKINIEKKKCPFIALTSNPCFEYWLILHFTDTSQSFSVKGKKSPGACAISLLKKYMPNYGKGNIDIFSSTKARLEDASQRAKRINSQRLDNPHTLVVDLMEKLQSLTVR